MERNDGDEDAIIRANNLDGCPHDEHCENEPQTDDEFLLTESR